MVLRGCAFDTQAQWDWYVDNLMDTPEKLRGFTSTSPDYETALYYAAKDNKPYRVIVLVPNVTSGRTAPSRAITYRVEQRGLTTRYKHGISYVLAEEVYDGKRQI